MRRLFALMATSIVVFGTSAAAQKIQLADEIARRLCLIFLPDTDGKRAVFGQYPRMQQDPHFRDHLLFFEYFHADTGRGVGASHQTGWTGLVADLLRSSRDTPSSGKHAGS